MNARPARAAASAWRALSVRSLTTSTPAAASSTACPTSHRSMTPASASQWNCNARERPTENAWWGVTDVEASRVAESGRS